MSSNTNHQLRWIVVAIVLALVIVPTFATGFGMMGWGPMMGADWSHGMWGAGDGAPGWVFVVGAVLQLLFLALLVGAGYLGYRALLSRSESTDPALEELRSAYARGELDDEEFERRRERLESGR